MAHFDSKMPRDSSNQTRRTPDEQKTQSANNPGGCSAGCSRRVDFVSSLSRPPLGGRPLLHPPAPSEGAGTLIGTFKFSGKYK